jgi:uncharacterized protein (TIGR02246 family)
MTAIDPTPVDPTPVDPTPMDPTPVDANSVATEFYAAIERAWNNGDGPAFGAAFGDGTVFVDIRGVRHHGGPAEIGADHQGIFDTIYRGSSIRYEVESARLLGDGIVLANGRATLDAPGGPLAGVHHAVSTVVIVHTDDGWSATAFHNTLVTA